MILIKANPELKNVYMKLIKTMKLPVNWNEVFVVKNNILILSGDVRSLVFNFGNKKIYTTILEIPAESSKLERMPSDSLLNNVMNITLYAFGKWGSISGLKVDKDYQTLNALFSQIFRPVKIEAGYSENNFRFYKDGVQVTYEDAMMATLRLLNSEGKLKDSQSLVTSDVTDKIEESSDNADDSDKDSSNDGDAKKEKNKFDPEDFENDYEIGLWHNLSWKKDTFDFKKAPKSEADAAKSRIGNNFYITPYICPKCEEKLYMGVYPVNKELLIDTEEGRVFMARAYSCHNCNTFYTPRPEKLLQEGDVYVVKFDEDRVAYEDYLDILGSRAERTTNPNFNEFESVRNRKNVEETESVSNSSSGSVMAEDNNTESEHTSKIKGLKEQFSKRSKLLPKKRDEFTEKPPTFTSRNSMDNTGDLENNNAKSTKKSSSAAKDTQTASKPAHIPISQLTNKTNDELRVILSDLERRNDIDQSNSNANTEYDYSTTGSDLNEEIRYLETVKEVLREKLAAKYDARIGIIDNLAPRQLTDLRNQISKETVFSKYEKDAYIKEIDDRLFKAEKEALAQKVELSKKKTYAEIEQIIGDVNQSDIPDDLKQETLDKLNLIKSDRANREVEHLLTHMPLHMDRQQLTSYLSKLDQYKEVDLTPYRSQLEHRLDMAEKEEISSMMKRNGKKDRSAWWELYEELQLRDYKEENTAPFLEKIYDKIKQLDEDAIERICPSIVTLSFADGLQAYEQISNGMFLPELKTNTLEMIQRRLTKLKVDESVQLMHKLKNDMEEKMTDLDGFYFYNAREEMKMSQGAGNRSRKYNDEEEALNDDGNEESNRDAMLRAINGYAAARGQYEYPLMVCDTSRSKSGKEGFVLTPDNIFYHTFLNSGKIDILDIDKVQSGKRIFSKGIFIKYPGRKKEKLPNNVKSENLEAFTKILDDFTTYLQEKPESRSIAYMAKETHEVIHCYRCGFVYKGGTICPKCGSKMNR